MLIERAGKGGKFRAELKSGEWRISGGRKGWVGSPIPAGTTNSSEISDMLVAFAEGRKWAPRPSEEIVAEKAREAHVGEAIEGGRDHCYSVSRHVRGLARAEYEEQGTFHQAAQSQAAEQWPGFERELFARLHGSADAIGESPDGDEWLRALHEQVDQVPEWKQLQAYCEKDAWASGIGASQITKALGASLGNILPKAPQQDAERVREEAEALALIGLPSEPRTEQARDLEEHGAVTALRIRGAEQANRRAVVLAATDALQEIQEVQAGLAALGVGNASGVASRVKAPRDEVRKLLQTNPRVRRIAQIAGRLKMRAREAQRSKVNYVPEQIVDVTVGAEIQRLLPSETMLLAEQETELLLLKKLLERQALEYRLEGRETEERGPMILCVDGSGSMEGARHEWAMGLGLALMEICAKQRRPFALIHFDSRVQKEFIVEKPADLDFPALVEMVTFFSNGGTSFFPPLARALHLIENTQSRNGLQKADAILLTDGGGEWGTMVANLKARGAGVYGVAIETDFSAEQKAELSGAAFLADLRPQNEAELEVVFSGV